MLPRSTGKNCQARHRSTPFTSLLPSFWTSRGHRCRPCFPPGSCLQFLSRIGFSNPTARRFFFIGRSLTHALALSASELVHNKKSPRRYTSMHWGGLELTKLAYTRFEDICHRGGRPYTCMLKSFCALILYNPYVYINQKKP